MLHHFHPFTLLFLASLLVNPVLARYFHWIPPRSQRLIVESISVWHCLNLTLFSLSLPDIVFAAFLMLTPWVRQDGRVRMLPLTLGARMKRRSHFKGLSELTGCSPKRSDSARAMIESSRIHFGWVFGVVVWRAMTMCRFSHRPWL